MAKRKQTPRHRTHSAQIHGVANDLLVIAGTISLSVKYHPVLRGRGSRLCQALALNECAGRLRGLAFCAKADEEEVEYLEQLLKEERQKRRADEAELELRRREEEEDRRTKCRVKIRLRVDPEAPGREDQPPDDAGPAPNPTALKLQNFSIKPGHIPAGKPQPCGHCRGTGKQHPNFADVCSLVCPHCQGRGRVDVSANAENGQGGESGAESHQTSDNGPA